MKNNKTKKIDNSFETFNDEDRLNAQIAKDLLKGVINGEEIEQRVKDLVRILVQGAMKGEMSAHSGYDKSSKVPAGQINRRNGSSKKILQTEQGPVRVDVPRDRHGSYEPVIIKKHERGFTGFNDQILALYARGMSSRDIAKTFEDIYGLDVSTDIVTQATASVINEVEKWQGRLLESTYTTVFIDALVVKTRETGIVTNRSTYIVVGVSLDCHRDVLGIWLQASEGAKFWQ